MHRHSTHINGYKHTDTCTHRPTCSHKWAHAYAYTQIHTRTQTHAHRHESANTHLHTYKQTCLYMRAHTKRTGMNTYTSVHTFRYMFMHTYAHPHVHSHNKHQVKWPKGIFSKDWDHWALCLLVLAEQGQTVPLKWSTWWLLSRVGQGHRKGKLTAHSDICIMSSSHAGQAGHLLHRTVTILWWIASST